MFDAQIARRIKDFQLQIQDFYRLLDRLPATESAKAIAALNDMWVAQFQRSYVLVLSTRPATSPRDFDNSYRNQNTFPINRTGHHTIYLAYPYPDKVNGYDLYLNGKLVGFLVAERMVLELESLRSSSRKECGYYWMITGKQISPTGKIANKRCSKVKELGGRNIARFFESSTAKEELLHQVKLYASSLFCYHTNRDSEEIYQEIKILDDETRLKEGM